MKIEKVSENQIRCTLTREDLDERQLKISEIAYGSEKAKNLFRDVMQQASYEFGFEAEDIPLMIEAIPMNTGCVVFIITKVEDPEELDTRFSRFAPSVNDSEESDADSEEDIYSAYDDDDDIMQIEPDESKPVGPTRIEATIGGNIQSAEDVFDLFKKLASKAAGVAAAQNQSKDQNKAAAPLPVFRVFSFKDINQLAEACHVVETFYEGESVLYKNPKKSGYNLVLVREETPVKDFLKLCNIMMEYGQVEHVTASGLAYIQEHCDILVPSGAIAAMARLK